MEMLTKEEKDKLVDERMALMRARNEKYRERHALIEAEKKALGAAAAPPPTVVSDGWKVPEYKDNWEQREGSHEPTRFGSGTAWPGESPGEKRDTWDNRTSGRPGQGGRGRTPRGGRGRGGFSHTPRTPPAPAETEEDWGAEADASPNPSDGWGGEGSVSTTPTGGRGGPRTAGSGRFSAKPRRPETELSYEATRKQNAAAYEQEVMNQGGGDSGSFLKDNFRDRPSNSSNQENRGGFNSRGGSHTHRHPRNYGGGDQMDLRDKIKRDRQRNSGGPRDFNPQVHMTGRERHEHNKWKDERERCDQQRMERSKDSHGNWKREWDNDKPHSHSAEQPPEEYNIYKEIDNKKHSSNDTSSMRGVSTQKGFVPGRGRGRGRGQRTRKPSHENIEQSRKVERNDEELTVTISASPTCPPQKGTRIDNSQTQHHGQRPNPTSYNGPTSHIAKKPNSPGKSLSDKPRPQTMPSSRAAATNTNNRHFGQHDHSVPNSMSNGDGRRGGSQGGRQGRGGRRGGRQGRGGHRGGHDGRSDPTSPAINSSEISQTPGKSSPMKEQSAANPSEKQLSAGSGTAVKPSNKGNVESHSVKKHKTSTSSEEQEIIVAEDQDDSDWVDCDSEEEDDDEKTPHVSKEPTPARSDIDGSKESTPVPQGTILHKEPQANTPDKAPAADNKEVGPESKQSEDPSSQKPPRPGLKIDVRTPITDDDEVVDVMKTPEGGRQRLDWAAEVESPVTTPDYQFGAM